MRRLNLRERRRRHDLPKPRARAGDVLICRQKLADLYEKQGGSGPLIFMIFENRFETLAGEPVVTEHLTRIAR